jgi:hypothetical protein
VESTGQMLESFRPVIPVIRAEHALPTGTTINGHAITRTTRTLPNVTVQMVEPLSHGGTVLNRSVNRSSAAYPANASRFTHRTEHDGRTALTFVQAAYRYNRTTQAATIYENATLTVNYTAPFDLRVDAADTQVGREQAITVAFTNRADEDITGTVMLQIGNATAPLTRTVTRNFTKQAETTLTVPFTPQTAGAYQVNAFFHSNAHVAGPRQATFTVHDPAALAKDVRINELLPHPTNGTEFVELYNPADVPIVTDRLRLADAAGNRMSLPESLPAHGFGIARQEQGLNAGRDTLTVAYCPEPESIHTVTYPAGLDPGERYHTAEQDTLFITAITPDAVGSDANESLRLRNPMKQSVNLSQYSLIEDNHDEKLSDTLAANRSRRIVPDAITLNNDGDTIRLVRRQPCTTVDTATYTGAPADRSVGWTADGEMGWMEPTPGTENTVTATDPEAAQQLVVNEMLPAPASRTEFIELYNPTDKRITLADMSLQDAAGTTTALSGTIAPRSYHVVRDPPTLNNDGDRITLQVNDKAVAEHRYAEAEAGSAVGRSPDRTGEMATVPPTPGGQNPYIVTETEPVSAEPTYAVQAAPEQRAGRTDNGAETVEHGADRERGASPFLQVDGRGTVPADVPFTVGVLVNDTGFDRVYSYAHNGTTPASTGVNGSGSWTANARPVQNGLQYVTLRNVVDPEYSGGTLDFAIRAAGNETAVTHRTTINVTRSPTLRIDRNASGTIAVNVSGRCTDCQVSMETPRNTVKSAAGVRRIRFDRTPGQHAVILSKNGHVIDREQITVNTSTQDGRQEPATARTSRDRMTGAVTGSSSTGLWATMMDLVDTLVVW